MTSQLDNEDFVAEFRVALRLRHPSMTAAEITGGVGVAPATAWSVGDQRVSPRRDLLGGTRSDTYWCAYLYETSDLELSEALAENLDYLDDVASFMEEFTASGGVAEYFVALFVKGNGGAVIDHSVLQRMAAKKIALALDLYATTRTGGPSQ